MAEDSGARFIASSIGALVAEVITLPADVAKTRLQVQRGSGACLRYHGFVDCLIVTSREEGMAACWRGLAPALLRQVCYSSLSMVLYEPIRDLIGDDGFSQKLMAGGTAGAISIAVFNWTEVIKTQLQTSHKGATMSGVAKSVYKKEGLLGFWAGLQPNVARTFLVNAAELGTYDQAKQGFLPLCGENNQWMAHLGASAVAGVTSAVVSTPADVIKTRLMNQAGHGHNYSGVLDAVRSTLEKEGVRALYKGFTPILLRKLMWTSIFFQVYERIRG